MKTLLEESLNWKAREATGLTDRWQPRWRKMHDLLSPGGCIRISGNEISNRVGLSLCLHLDENVGLHILLGWPSIWLKLGIKENPEFDVNSSSRRYGFSFTDGGTLHLNWGRASKIVWWPFRQQVIRQEYLRADGTWALIPKKPYNASADNAAYFAQREKTEAVYVEDWFYRTRWCEKQEGKARFTVDRIFLAPWALSWLPFLAKERRAINVTFNREVGSRAGSWKGGCIGCSYYMRKGEVPTETFSRMMDERTF